MSILSLPLMTAKISVLGLIHFFRSPYLGEVEQMQQLCSPAAAAQHLSRKKSGTLAQHLSRKGNRNCCILTDSVSLVSTATPTATAMDPPPLTIPLCTIEWFSKRKCFVFCQTCFKHKLFFNTFNLNFDLDILALRSLTRSLRSMQLRILGNGTTHTRTFPLVFNQFKFYQNKSFVFPQ